MMQPEGFTLAYSTLVCRLDKVLYGLKRAHRAWFSKLTSTLV